MKAGLGPWTFKRFGQLLRILMNIRDTIIHSEE